MSTVVVSVAAVVVSRGLYVLGLWLRLRSQERRDRNRLRYLRLALALPADRELVEVQPDGTGLRITRTHGEG